MNDLKTATEADDFDMADVILAIVTKHVGLDDLITLFKLAVENDQLAEAGTLRDDIVRELDLWIKDTVDHNNGDIEGEIELEDDEDEDEDEDDNESWRG